MSYIRYKGVGSSFEARKCDGKFVVKKTYKSW